MTTKQQRLIAAFTKLAQDYQRAQGAVVQPFFYGLERGDLEPDEPEDRLHDAEMIIAQALTCGVHADPSDWMAKAIEFLGHRAPVKTNDGQ